MVCGTALFGAYRILMLTGWDNFNSILVTIGKFAVLMALVFFVEGTTLWVIREHVLPLSSDELSKELDGLQAENERLRKELSWSFECSKLQSENKQLREELRSKG